MSQTAYTENPAEGLEGLIADLRNSTLITGVADGDIPFGRFVHRVAGGAADDRPMRCDLPALTGEVTGQTGLGFATSDSTMEQASGVAQWTAGVPTRIMRSGLIWMLAEDAVALGDPVFVRFTVGAGTKTLGRVRTDVDGATAVQLPGARFMSITTGTDELALVEYRPQT